MTAVAVVTTVGLGFLIGHGALVGLMPLAVLALGMGYRAHRQPAPLGLGIVALAIAYVHVFAGTPEWTLSFVMLLSVGAAIGDWWATGRLVPPWSAKLQSQVRRL